MLLRVGMAVRSEADEGPGGLVEDDGPLCCWVIDLVETIVNSGDHSLPVYTKVRLLIW